MRIARPLALGPITVDPPVVLAPMAGVTDAAYRGLCAGFGAGLYVSEMVTARALVEGNAKTRAMVAFAPEERFRSVQLYGVDPATVAAAVELLVSEHRVDHVDLNFGCPVPKVTRKGGGAAVPARRALLARIVEAAVRAAAPVPVTVKFRIGVSDAVVTYLDTGRAAADAGAAAVTLHARTAEAAYSGSADWSAIARLKDHVGDRVAVLGNGDIWEAADAVAMVAATGCDGVVIGRGCLGRPWLFAELAHAFAGASPVAAPDLGEVLTVARRHAERLVALAGTHGGLRRFRKHMAWYLTGYPVGGVVRRRAGQLDDLAQFDELASAVDPTLHVAPEALRAPRGHRHGPRPVPLPDGWLDDPDDPTPPAGAELIASGG